MKNIFFILKFRRQSQTGNHFKENGKPTDPFEKYTSELEESFKRSFVRGIFRRLADNVVTAKDFQIALWHCSPIEETIDITDAVKRTRMFFQPNCQLIK